jgi:hypothetical protein
MKTKIAQVNTVLIISMTILLFLGLTLMTFGIFWLSKDFILLSVFTLPLILASKGIQFIIEKQLRKALMSIVMLSAFCILSLFFAFI